MFADSVASTYHGSRSFFCMELGLRLSWGRCGRYPSGDPCLYAKDPADANTKVLDYYILGTYRHKCGQAGWNCNNTWWTQTEIWWWNDPYLGDLETGITCSYKWNVLNGQGGIGCNDG